MRDPKVDSEFRPNLVSIRMGGSILYFVGASTSLSKYHPSCQIKVRSTA